MKSVQSMSLSMTPVKRYGNPESGCESYMPAAHSELPNSIPLSMPEPIEKLEPLDPTVVQSYGETEYPRSIRAVVELSPTSYLGVGAVRHNLLRCGNSALGMSSLWSTGSGINTEAGSGGSGDDGNGNDVDTGSGKCSDDGGGGSGGEGIRGGGDDQGDSGDGGGDGDVGAAAYSAMRASIDGDIGGSSLAIFRALRRRV
ncbi:hypothetical protein Tco_1454207 [Tanacetum coccineum]